MRNALAGFADDHKSKHLCWRGDDEFEVTDSQYGDGDGYPHTREERPRPSTMTGCSTSRERGTSGHAAAPTEAREGCSGLVGEACARQLDGGVDGRRPPHPR